MRKKATIILTLFMLFFTQLIFAQSKDKEKIVYENFKMANPNFTQIELPLHFYKNGLPIIDITINDQLFNLILDTGFNSGTFSLKTTALNKIKVKDLDQLDQAETYTDIYGEKHQQRVFKIPSLKIGNMKLRDFIASEETRSFVPEDGIIGNDFLKNFHILIDYSNSRAVLFNKQSYPRLLNLDTWEKIPFEIYEDCFVINGLIDHNGHTMRFCLDTGSMCIIDNISYGTIKLGQHPQATVKDAYVQTEHFYIGATDLGPMKFVVDDDPEPQVVDGFLGHNFLENRIVFIDYDHKVIFFKNNLNCNNKTK